MLKFSKQRELIKLAVTQNRIHPSADTVYTILKAKNPSLSLGTVYRNLNLLANSNIIRKIYVPNGSDRFDGDLSNHFHISCSVCGAIFDADIQLIEDFTKTINEHTGFIINSHKVIIDGVCNNCQ